MNGAEYALIVNVCVALLFATTFGIIRLSYDTQRSASLFLGTFLFGMFAPLSELGIRFTACTRLFTATSYGSLLASALTALVGVAVLARSPVRRSLVLALAIGGICCRAAIWNGPRNTLGYGIVFQAPFVVSFFLSAFTSARQARASREGLWLMLAIVFGLMTTYFAAKPFFAAAFGSGATPRDYAGSSYALFSQALGGIMIVMSGLVILLIMVRSMLDGSIRDAETDPLTGVANRRGVERRASSLIERATRSGQPLAVILLDLDHFKRVNDVFGHATGDAVLRAFADALTSSVPPSAVVARTGGEEFAILLERTTLRGAALTAEAIRKATTALGDHLPPVTVSGGIAELKAGDTLASLFDRADARAYLAKANGRDQMHSGF